VLQHPELFSFTSKGTKASKAKAKALEGTPTKPGATPKRGMKIGGSSPRSKKKGSAASAATAPVASVVVTAEHAPLWQDTVAELLSGWRDKDTRKDAEILLVFYLNFEPSSAATDRLAEIMKTFKAVGEKREQDWRTLMYSNFQEKYKIDPRSYYESVGPQDGKLSRRAFNVKKGKAPLPVPKLEEARSPRGTAELGRSQVSADADSTATSAASKGQLYGAVTYKATAPLPTTSREAAAELAAAGGLSAFVVDGLTNVQEVANGRYDMQKTVQSEDRPTFKQAKRPGASASCWLYYAGGAWLLSPGLGAEECYGYLPSTATEPPEEGSDAAPVWLVPVQSATGNGGWEWAPAPQVRVRRWLAGHGTAPQLSISQSKAGAAAMAAEAAGMPNLSAAAAAIAASPAPVQKKVAKAASHFFGGFGVAASAEPEPELSLSVEETPADDPTSSLAADFFAAAGGTTGDADGGIAVDNLVIIEETAEELICLVNDEEYLVDLESEIVFHVVPGGDEDPAEVGTWSHESRQIFFIDGAKPSGSSLDLDPNLAAIQEQAEKTAVGTVELKSDLWQHLNAPGSSSTDAAADAATQPQQSSTEKKTDVSTSVSQTSSRRPLSSVVLVSVDLWESSDEEADDDAGGGGGSGGGGGFSDM